MLVALMQMESADDGWLLTLGGMDGRTSVFSSLSCSLFGSSRSLCLR